MDTQPTNREILEAVQASNQRIDDLVEVIHDSFTHVDEQFAHMRSDIVEIKATMVTKDYLDEKLGDLRVDMVMLVRKEDKKLLTLVEELAERNIVDQAAKKRIAAMEPFGTAA